MKLDTKPTLVFLVFTSAPLAISSRARADSPTLTALMSALPSCFCEARTHGLPGPIAAEHVSNLWATLRARFLSLRKGDVPSNQQQATAQQASVQATGHTAGLFR